jgi:hypothetical protein
MSRALIIPFFMLLLLGVTSPGLATNTPTIELEAAVYFLSPGGDVVLVEPGTYETEATEEWLQLIPQGGERNEALLLAAQAVTHTEILKVPRALSLGGEHDIHMVALFLPDGTGLWMMGSYSGIRTRSAKTALQAKRRFLQKKMDVLRQKTRKLKRSGKRLSRSELNQTIKDVEAMQDTIRNKRQMASTAFQNFDQKANQQYNLLSSIMKAMNEMRMGTVRNMM